MYPETANPADMIRAGLVQRGLPPHIADGFVMNFRDESGLNPGINEAAPMVPGSRGGFGLAQWTGPRRVALETFASNRGLPVDSIDAQLDFLMTELQGPESRAARSIMAAPDSAAAADAVLRDFLRPAPEHVATRSADYLGGSGSTGLLGGAGGDTLGTQGLLGTMPQEQRAPSIWDRLEGVPILGGLASPDRRARLAIGLSGMSMNPNEGLMAANMRGIEERADEKKINQTVQWLQSIGRGDLAEAVAAGSLLGGDAAAIAMAPPDPGPEPIEINGQLVDPATGAVIGDYRTAEATTPGHRLMTPEEIAAAGLPAGSAWQIGPDGQIAQIDGSESGTSYIATGDAAASLGLDPQFSYNVTSGPEGISATRIGGEAPSTTVNVGAGETAFNTETGKLLAAEANSIVQQGAQAQRGLGQLTTLEAALASAPQGFAGGLTQFASSLGIKLDGASDVELADAIISQLVPQQRPPGSGTMSDADLALFKRSLPSLINTPQGNQMIVQTMRAIAEYDVKRGDIARRQQLGEIDARAAAAEYAALGNPLAGFVEPGTGTAGTPPAIRRFNPETGALE